MIPGDSKEYRGYSVRCVAPNPPIGRAYTLLVIEKDSVSRTFKNEDQAAPHYLDKCIGMMEKMNA